MTATMPPRGGAEAARRRHPTAKTAPARAGRRPAGRRSGTFLGLLAIVVTLNLLGLVMVLSASSVAAIDEYNSSWYYFTKQAMWVGIGAVVLLLTMRVDYHWWRRLALPLVGLSSFLLVLVLVPGVGINVNGSSRWLGAGSLRLQPAELAKLAVLVFCADLLARRAAWIHDTRVTLRPVLLVFGGTASLVLLQPNLGTTIIIAAIAFSLLFVAGTPLRSLAAVGVLGIAAATLLSVAEEYRRARLFAFLHPWDDPLNKGYQTIQSLVGLASGGITGTGLGASKAKWGFLPFAHTDFIYAIIGEELGLIGTIGVVLLFVALGVLGIRTALLAPDRFGMLIATGVTAWFLVQAFVNIGAVIGILPITGVPLPFVSFGGSSLLFGMAGAGLLCNVARQGRAPERRSVMRA
jgi:cell division protein FtsW